MERECIGCGVSIPPARRSNTRYCNILCRRKAFRNRHPERCREWVRNANRRRYHDDPLFRLMAQLRTKKWRQIQTYGAVVGDNPLNHTKDRYRHARALGYRSGLEVAVCKKLDEQHVRYQYEPFHIPFTPRPKKRRYKPDVILPNYILVELKGRFLTADRQKHLSIKEEYPDVDIRFVFSNANARISKQSKTTYAVWCDTHGFKYATGSVPRAWIEEATNGKAKALIEGWLKEQKRGD